MFYSITWLTLISLTLVSNISALPPKSLWQEPENSGTPAMDLGINTITVPFGPKKISPFIPKFVDPKMMISKKTDFLNNLFGSLGPVNYQTASDFTSNDFKPFLFAANPDNEPLSLDDPDFQKIVKDNSAKVTEIKNFKRGALKGKAPKFEKPSGFGPFGAKFGFPGAGNPYVNYAGSKFTPGFMPPFAESKFPDSYSLPFAKPKFGPPMFNFPSAPSVYGYDEYNLSKRKRSAKSPTNDPQIFGLPPSYLDLGTIPEELEKDLIPKESMPIYFGPNGPFAPTPIVDPSIFMAKKATFLNKLFTNLATSTALPPTATDFPIPKSTIVPPGFWSPFDTSTDSPVAVTDTPVEKSTIVPPDFWLPSSIIPGPGEYTFKVATFLDKLFDSIKLNKTSSQSSIVTRSVEYATTKDDMNQSIQNLEIISAAKDAIVDSIMDELASLKLQMFNNVNDLIMLQKMTVASSASSFSKKPFKAGLWGPGMVDQTLPFKQKMSVLNEVFDTLIALQKNISMAVSDAIKNSTIISDLESSLDHTKDNFDLIPYNVSLADIVAGKIADMNKPVPIYQSIPFWMTYPKYKPAKRHIDDDNDYNYENEKEIYKRAIQMAMHQGYQSMPPGAIESIQAHGGSAPGHQGGGIKFFIQMPKEIHQIPINDNYYNSDWKKWDNSDEIFKNQLSWPKTHHHHH